MAKLLETWLNNEVNMSRRITSFADDFSNGYLLGELLYKFNQQMDFEAFVDKHERIHRLNNFVRLIPSFKALQLKFDTMLMHKIMNKQEGAAETLLYQIKMALEKTNAPIDVTIAKKAGQVVEQTPVQRIRPARRQFDEMEEKNYILTLQRLHKPQKDLDIDKKLQKYVDEAVRIQERADKKQHEESHRESELKEEKRKAMINKLQRNAGFMEDWEQKGVEEWKKNMEVKKKREQMELKYQIRRAEQMKVHAEGLHMDAKAETMQGIDQFEQSLAKMGISAKLSKTAGPRPAQIQPPAPLTDTSIKPPAVQERDIKRRTMAARLYNVEKAKERSYRSDALIRKLDTLSGREEVLAAEIWSTTHYTELIMAHRKLRETRYERRRDYDAELAQLKEAQALNFHSVATRTELELELARGRQYSQAVSTLRRAQRSEDCFQMVDLVVNLMQELSAFQETTDLEAVDQRIMGNWMTLFEAGIPAEQMGSETAETAIKAKEIREYIGGGGVWANQVQTNNGTFNNAVNYLLTEAVADLISLLFPADEFAPTLAEPAKLPVKLAFVGYPYSGETTQANRLRSRLGIEVLDVLKVLSEHQGELAEQLMDGNVVDEDVTAQLLVKELEKVREKGWALVNFPDNSRQAEALERYLTGHTPHPPVSVATAKLEALYEVSPPRKPEERTQRKFKSGLDYVFWVQTSKEECLRRCFGQRVDPNTGLCYHVDDDPPPTSAAPLIEGLQPVDKWTSHRGAVIDRMVAFDRNMAALSEFLEDFGQEEPLLVPLDGSKTIEDIGQEVDSYVRKLLRKRSMQEKEEQAAAASAEKIQAETLIAGQDWVQSKQERLQMFAEDEKETIVAVELAAEQPESRVSPLAQQLFSLWESGISRYRERLVYLFERKRVLRFGHIQRFNGIQAGFIKFLYRPSPKTSVTLDFQLAYNQFVDENPDMLEDPRCLEELHQRVDDLCNRLCDINDQRVQEAETEYAEMIEGEGVVTSLHTFVSVAIEMMQEEVNRFQLATLVLEDYYQMKQGLPLKGVLDQTPTLIDLEEPSPGERLNKALERAMKVTALVHEEIIDPKAKKKEEKKPPAKGKGAAPVVVEEEIVRQGPLQEELNQALKVEEDIFKFRVQRIAKSVETLMSESKPMWDAICEKMRSWIRIFAQSENQVVTELSNYLRSTVEVRGKLQPLILMNLLEVKIDKDWLVYMDPPPEFGPPKEIKYPDRFSITQLESLVDELSKLGGDYIPKAVIASILQRRKCLSLILDDRGSLPEMWQQLTEAQLVELVNYFDAEGNGLVEWKALANSVCLLYSLPVEANTLKAYRKSLEGSGTRLSLKQFLTVCFI